MTGAVDKTLTVGATGAGSGSGASDPTAIDCGATCRHDFSSGASVTLTATAAEGSVFTGWAGACSGTGPCTITMIEDRSVTLIRQRPRPGRVVRTGEVGLVVSMGERK